METRERKYTQFVHDLFPISVQAIEDARKNRNDPYISSLPQVNRQLEINRVLDGYLEIYEDSYNRMLGRPAGEGFIGGAETMYTILGCEAAVRGGILPVITTEIAYSDYEDPDRNGGISFMTKPLADHPSYVLNKINVLAQNESVFAQEQQVNTLLEEIHADRPIPPPYLAGMKLVYTLFHDSFVQKQLQKMMG